MCTFYLNVEAFYVMIEFYVTIEKIVQAITITSMKKGLKLSAARGRLHSLPR